LQEKNENISPILRVGEHFKIELPDDVMEYLKVKPGDTVMMTTEEKSIILSKP